MDTSTLTTETIGLITLVVTAIGVFVNFLYTAITLFLWITTRKTIQLNAAMVEQNAKMIDQMINQVQYQIALNNTSSDHKVVDSHRELFLSIILNPELLKILADNSKVATSVIQKNYLATFLINHCSVIFSYKQNKIISLNFLESFAKDSQHLFAMPFIKERWEQVKDFHTSDFQHFVERYLLKEEEIDMSKLLSEFGFGEENELTKKN